MSEHIYLLTISLFLGTILSVFGMRYWSVLQQAKARLANEGAYRQMAERAAVAQAESAAALASIQAAIADVRTRLISVEKILKEVE